MTHTVTIDFDDKFVRKWYAQCSCGWVGTGATEKEVQGYVRAHHEQVKEREERNSTK
jgi:hypothetical protein